MPPRGYCQTLLRTRSLRRKTSWFMRPYFTSLCIREYFRPLRAGREERQREWKRTRKGEGRGREGCTCIEYCPWWQLSWNRDCSLLLLSFLFIYKLEISNKLEIRFGFEMFNSEQFEKFARAESFIFSAKRIIDVFYLEKFEGTWKTVHNLGKMFLKRD